MWIDTHKLALDRLLHNLSRCVLLVRRRPWTYVKHAAFFQETVCVQLLMDVALSVRISPRVVIVWTVQGFQHNHFTDAEEWSKNTIKTNN
jgi:hypothetical protein